MDTTDGVDIDMKMEFESPKEGLGGQHPKRNI